MNAIPWKARGATHLECTWTGETFESEQLIGLSPAGKPLFARYDLDTIRRHFRPGDLAGRRPDLWRYEEVLPVRVPECQLSLGEGWTPLTDAPRLAKRYGMRRLWVKNEGMNPTGSFKDRGLSLAVSRAKELGAKGSWRSLRLVTPAARRPHMRPPPGSRSTLSRQTTRRRRLSRRSADWARTWC